MVVLKEDSGWPQPGRTTQENTGKHHTKKHFFSIQGLPADLCSIRGSGEIELVSRRTLLTDTFFGGGNTHHVLWDMCLNPTQMGREKVQHGGTCCHTFVVQAQIFPISDHSDSHHGSASVMQLVCRKLCQWVVWPSQCLFGVKRWWLQLNDRGYIALYNIIYIYTPRPGVPPEGRHTRPGGISITYDIYIYMTRVLGNIKLPPSLNFTFNWEDQQGY